MITFVGAGSGDPELITIKGAKKLGEADVVIYAGSLVNPGNLTHVKQGAAVYNSASMTLDEVIDFMRERRELWRAIREKTLTALLWSGLLTLGSAIYHYIKAKLGTP